MNMCKCEKGHIYDRDKFRLCPHCANENSKANVDILGLEQSDVETAIPTSQTQQKYDEKMMRRVVGWLVCVGGACLGENFTLYEGENHIGRMAHMDVALTKDLSVSRQDHAIIVYENRKFQLFCGKTGSPVYCNQKELNKYCQLKGRTSITLGECELIFVPFCDNSFSWQ